MAAFPKSATKKPGKKAGHHLAGSLAPKERSRRDIVAQAAAPKRRGTTDPKPNPDAKLENRPSRMGRVGATPEDDDYLSPKLEEMCRGYLIHWNKSRAAREAGYSPKTAGSIGCEIFNTLEVQARLKVLRDRRADAMRVTQESVLRKLALMANYDPRMLYDEQGNLRPPHEWSDEAAAVISGVKVSGRPGRGDGETVEVKVANVEAVQQLAMRHLGLLKDQLILDHRPQVVLDMAKLSQLSTKELEQLDAITKKLGAAPGAT